MLKTMVDGYRVIRPFEDIQLDGKVEPKLECRGSDSVSANAVTLGGESLVGMRDYRTDTKLSYTIKIPCSGKAEVHDARTKES